MSEKSTPVEVPAVKELTEEMKKIPALGPRTQLTNYSPAGSTYWSPDRSQLFGIWSTDKTTACENLGINGYIAAALIVSGPVSDSCGALYPLVKVVNNA